MYQDQQTKIQEVVKTMERGQITIPASIRKILNIDPQTWMWIKLLTDNTIIIEPIEKASKKEELNAFLEKMSKDKKVYWTKEDDKALSIADRKSIERMKKLYE